MMDRIGPVRVRNLTEALGSPEAVWEATEGDLCGVSGIGREVARGMMAQRNEVDPEKELRRVEAMGGSILTWDDAEYPGILKEIYDPPIVLYVMGQLTAKDRHAIAVVGTRHPTHYGTAMADQLSYGLARAGLTVVSGLARGIDTAAHQAALKAKGRTIAVLGGALDQVYPPENRKLAREITELGAVICEYPLGRKPDRQTFPYRNRIVSGLSLGTLVVEAGTTSGTVITSKQALEQGRTVFAVPGRVDTPSARGCHALIKQGAKLCETIDDVLDDLDPLLPLRVVKEAEAIQPQREPELNESEQAVVRALYRGALSVDELAREAGVSPVTLSSMLLGLEMKRVVTLLPGRRIELRPELYKG